MITGATDEYVLETCWKAGCFDATAAAALACSAACFRKSSVWRARRLGRSHL